MLRRVAPVRTDDSEERNASIIGVTRIGEIGTSSISSNRRMMRKKYCVRNEALVWNTRMRMQRGVGAVLALAVFVDQFPDM
jgi:hypothetical protein